jgi:transcriptional regulator with XRE-family HTH domain
METEVGPSPAEQFGANLRLLRRSYGWSQQTVGDLAGLHRTEIGKLEGGLRDPRLQTIVRLARALRVDPGLLVVGIAPRGG